jgi:hypothetical protein
MEMRISSSDDQAVGPSGATGGPGLVLRAEGAAALMLACLFYARLGGGWGLFAVLLLAPDLSLLAYLAGPRVGAAVYNAAHSHVGPALLGVAAWAGGPPILAWLALIWAAHVGLDRMLGYGLKYAAGFHFTHLGRIGRAAA